MAPVVGIADASWTPRATKPIEDTPPRKPAPAFASAAAPAHNGAMLAKLLTHSLLGIQAKPVEVEMDISPGAMPRTILIGLAEAAVRESTAPIERALVNSGYTRPVDRVIINLSRDDLPKERTQLWAGSSPP